MKNINIGIANLIVSNKLNKQYQDNKSIVESKKIVSDFFEIIKKSPVLQLEFKVFSNIEGKHIENDFFAKEYIDNNIKLFEIYSLDEISVERKKLNKFLRENVNSKLNNIDYSFEKINLYNAIDTLITESLKNSDEVDVDKIHESFTFIFNHIKTTKKQLVENISIDPINEDVLEIAVSKFNEKYTILDENDKNLLKVLIKSNDTEKNIILETYKTETLEILEGLNKDNVKDNISKAIQKIKEMAFDKKNVDDNIIGLHELKKELL